MKNFIHWFNADLLQTKIDHQQVKFLDRYGIVFSSFNPY